MAAPEQAVQWHMVFAAAAIVAGLGWFAVAYWLSSEPGSPVAKLATFLVLGVLMGCVFGAVDSYMSYRGKRRQT